MPSPTYTLRPATDNDYAFLEALHTATMRDVVTQVWGWDAAIQGALFRRNFDPTRSQIVVVDGADAGVIALEKRDNAWFLAGIEIAPAYQSRGLGARLIGAIVAEAHAAGLPVTLQVLKVNRAQYLYERLGFVVTGSTATHFLNARSADVARSCPHGRPDRRSDPGACAASSAARVDKRPVFGQQAIPHAVDVRWQRVLDVLEIARHGSRRDRYGITAKTHVRRGMIDQ